MSTASSLGTVHVVTGERCVGKTTFCRVLINEARSHNAGLAAVGVLSPKVFLQERETAIDAIDVASGQRRRLATRRDEGDASDGPATVRWRFDANTLLWGNAVLRSATPCDLLVVDEIGPLEFERGQGWTGGLTALDSGAYADAFVVVRSELIEQALDRWPGARVIRIDNAAGAEQAGRRSALRLSP